MPEISQNGLYISKDDVEYLQLAKGSRLSYIMLFLGSLDAFGL